MKSLIKLTVKNYLLLIFLISAAATFGSLGFSDVADLTPCALCWYQRIFMYPIFFLSASSFLFNQPLSKKFLMVLAIPGAVVAFYNYILQMFPIPNAFVVCTGGVDCSKIDWTLNQVISFEPFKYVTIPLLSLIAFIVIAALLWIASKYKDLK